MAACGYAQELIAIAELMGLFAMPPADILRSGDVDWLALLQSPVAASAGPCK